MIGNVILFAVIVSVVVLLIKSVKKKEEWRASMALTTGCGRLPSAKTALSSRNDPNRQQIEAVSHSSSLVKVLRLTGEYGIGEKSHLPRQPSRTPSRRAQMPNAWNKSNSGMVMNSISFRRRGNSVSKAWRMTGTLKMSTK